MTIRVLLADDQALLRSAFKVLVDSEPDMEVVGEAADGAQAVTLARSERPDVVLMDIRMPGTDGLAATRLITADPELSDVRIVMLTTFEVDEYVVQSLRAGASGFLGKGAEPEELLGAIRIAHAGEALLSPAATKGLIASFLAQGSRRGRRRRRRGQDRAAGRAHRPGAGGPGPRGGRTVQRRDRRTARRQPPHREDARQPGHGQARRPGPGPAGGHGLRIGTGPPPGGVTPGPGVLQTRYARDKDVDPGAEDFRPPMADRRRGASLRRIQRVRAGVLAAPACRRVRHRRETPCPGCPDSASRNGP